MAVRPLDVQVNMQALMPQAEQASHQAGFASTEALRRDDAGRAESLERSSRVNQSKNSSESDGPHNQLDYVEGMFEDGGRSGEGHPSGGGQKNPHQLSLLAPATSQTGTGVQVKKFDLAPGGLIDIWA